MSEGLFHIDPDGQMVSMTVTPYEAEDVLQSLLETHPDLLAGGQMTPESPRRWALVRREHGIPDRAEAGSRWSVDHLFVDQDAVPTLVEVKRSTDTRIRREVVGQMLDYAANGVRYWPPPELKAAFVATQQALGHDPGQVITDLSDDPTETLEGFFARVGDNLRAGRIRMVFVADVIPDELMRITEFLNEQMNPAEVFAVEVKQYTAAGHQGTVIVPAVYGRTATASVKATSRSGTPDRDALLARSVPATHEILRRVDALAQELDLAVQETPTSSLLKTRQGYPVINVYLANWDSLEVPLKQLREHGFDEEASAILSELRMATSKKLTEKFPTLPTADAVAQWPKVRAVIIRVATLYSSAWTGNSESTPSLPDRSHTEDR